MQGQEFPFDEAFTTFLESRGLSYQALLDRHWPWDRGFRGGRGGQPVLGPRTVMAA